MIVVTGGSTDELGPMLGLIKERTPAIEHLDENKVKQIVRQEMFGIAAEGKAKSQVTDNQAEA
jgi:hypothetical protein